MESEDKLLLGQIEDKIRACSDQYAMTHTNFLDMRQAVLAETLAKESRAKYLLWGGFEDAERRILIFLPDYLEEDMVTSGEDCPLSLMRVTSPKGSRPLTHRDYLGSLMGLGIKREIVGDILVKDNGADIIILKEMEDFLLSEYSKAGRNNLHVELLPMESLDLGEVHTEEFSDTVASLRLDNVVASAFKTSRTKAQEAVKQGIVYLNNTQNLKPDMEVREGDKVVLRGKGKVILREISGTSKKGRIIINMTRFL